MNEDQDNQKVTPATGGYSFDVFQDAADSWNGKINGFEDAVFAVGKKYNLFDYKGGEIDNFPYVYNQLIQGIYKLGDNPYVEKIVEKLVGNAERFVPKKEYENLEIEQRGSGAAMIDSAIEQSFKDNNIPGDGFQSIVRDKLEIKLAKDLPQNKTQDTVTTPPVNNNQEDDRRKKEEEEEQKDDESKEGKNKDKNKKDDEQPTEDGDGRTEHKPNKNEFEDDTEDDIRYKKEKLEKGKTDQQDKAEGQDYDPDDIKDGNPKKSTKDVEDSDNQPEDEENNLEKQEGDQKQPSESKEEQSSENEESSNSDGGRKQKEGDKTDGKDSKDSKEGSEKTGDKTSEGKTGSEQGGETGKPADQQSSPKESSRSADKNLDSAGKNEAPSQSKLGETQQPPSTSQLKPGEVPTSSNGLPQNATPTPESLPSSGNLPGNTKPGLQTPPSKLTSQGGIQPTSVQQPLNLPKVTKLPKQGGINTLGRGGGRIAQNRIPEITKALKPVAKTGANAASKVGSQAAKAGAQLLARAGQAVVSLISQAVAALASLGAPLIIVIVIIAIIIGFMFMVVVFSACPGINPAAQKTTEIVGADKMKFNEKLGDKCKPAKTSSDPCSYNKSSATSTLCLQKDLQGKNAQDRVALWRGNGGVLSQDGNMSVGIIREVIAAGTEAGVSAETIAFVLSVAPTETGANSNPWGVRGGAGNAFLGIAQVGENPELVVWGNRALGRSVSASEFLSSPPIQMKVIEEGLKEKISFQCAPGKKSDIYEGAYAWLTCAGADQNKTTSDSYAEAAERNYKIITCGGANDIPSIPSNNAKLEQLESQNFLAFNPFGSVGVQAQSGLPLDAWLPPGNSYDIEDSGFRSTKRLSQLDGSGGIDFTLAPPGKQYEESRNAPIVSHLPGQVIFIDNPGPATTDYGSYGNVVGVYYPGINKTAVYSHLESINVKVGDAVSPGSLLGKQGSSGSSRGATPDGTYIHIDLRLVEGNATNSQLNASSATQTVEKTKGAASALNDYSDFMVGMLTYYSANSDKILANNFSATSIASTSGNPCPDGTTPTGINTTEVSKEKGSATLLEIARRNSAGKDPDSRCWFHVANYIVEAGGFGLVDGTANFPLTQAAINGSGPFGSLNEESATTQGLYWNEHLAELGLRNLVNDNPSYSPYNAPAGSIVVVAAGYGRSTNPAGDIAVADGQGNFYNGGEMPYGGPKHGKMVIL